MIQLGTRVRDIVSGLEGITTARCEYLNGCVQYCVKPPIRDGKSVDGEYIDQQQLQVVDEGITGAVQAKATGGPARDTPSTTYRG